MQASWVWYDFWIGFYWDRDGRILYCCPLPTVVFSFHFRNEVEEEWLKGPAEDEAAEAAKEE